MLSPLRDRNFVILDTIDSIVTDNFHALKQICSKNEHILLVERLTNLFVEVLIDALDVPINPNNIVTVHSIAVGLVGTYVSWFRNQNGIPYDELVKINRSILAMNTHLITVH